MTTTEPASQAEIITQRLAELGLSVPQFARELGVQPAFIYSVMKGQRRLTKPATVERAAEVLGISSDTLYVSARHLPPDVLRHMQMHPILLEAVRKLAAKLDAQAASTGPAKPATAPHAHVP